MRRASRALQPKFETLEARAVPSHLLPRATSPHSIMASGHALHALHNHVDNAGHQAPAMPQTVRGLAVHKVHKPARLRRHHGHKPPLPHGLVIAQPPVNVTNPGTLETQLETAGVAVQYGGKTNLVIGYIDYGLSSNTKAIHVTSWSFTRNGGKSFHYGHQLPAFPNDIGDWGDPGLAVNNATGEVVFSSFSAQQAWPGGVPTTNAVLVWRSYNGGQSFSQPVNITPGFPSNYVVDKPAIAFDNWTGTGQGTVYVAYTVFAPQDTAIYLSRSFDGGLTWQPPVRVTDGVGAAIAITPDHQVHIFCWLGGIYTAVSSDFGATFGYASEVEPLLSTTGDVGVGGGIRSNCFLTAAVNPVTGDIYGVWDDISPVPGEGARVYEATLNYRTQIWSDPQLVSVPGTADVQWEPNVAANGTQIAITWFRQNAVTGGIDRWASIGTVNLQTGSVTLSPPAPLTGKPFIPMNQWYKFIGDYEALIATPSGFFSTFPYFRRTNMPGWTDFSWGTIVGVSFSLS